uniref:Lipase n=1 Tax=Tetranychus urticae TaxID=32264 RepID=T1KPH2_TETUR
MECTFMPPFKTAHDEALTCGQLIVSRGFKYERHFVTTEDGYILTLYRIINPNAQAARGSKLIPVLLVHGIFTSCSSWMINGFDGFIEPWFDVWIANNRGTAYSRNHTRLDPDTEFWDFTFSEMGEYDAPAMVDYIIEETGHEKIVWIGYSEGTTQNFIQLAMNPAAADKFYLNINIEPGAFYGESKGLLTVIPRNRLVFGTLDDYVGPFSPSLPEFDALLTIATIPCTIEVIKPICIEIYLFGVDRRMIDKKLFQVLTSQIDTTSTKNLIHYLQSVKYDQVSKYDYGPEMNQEMYSSDELPKYPFENVPTCNLVLIGGLNDYFSDEKDFQNNRPFIDHVITYPDWSHTDIIFGNHAYEYAHSVIVDILRENLP